jgi:hypothetical protein
MIINHYFDFSFTAISEKESFQDFTGAELREEMINNLKNLTDNDIRFLAYFVSSEVASDEG